MGLAILSAIFLLAGWSFLASPHDSYAVLPANVVLGAPLLVASTLMALVAFCSTIADWRAGKISNIRTMSGALLSVVVFILSFAPWLKAFLR